jgi:hypothetical protein
MLRVWRWCVSVWLHAALRRVAAPCELEHDHRCRRSCVQGSIALRRAREPGGFQGRSGSRGIKGRGPARPQALCAALRRRAESGQTQPPDTQGRIDGDNMLARLTDLVEGRLRGDLAHRTL